MNDQYITYEEYQKNFELESIDRDCNNVTASSRDEMLKQIKECKFTIIDLSLYLDTHPNDRRAIAMHKEHTNKYRRLTDEYQRMYGPLTIMYPCNKWRWLEEPWPWERGNF